MKNKPNGNVTFLFTDIEGSTHLAQEFPESLLSALEKHHAIMHKTIKSNNGFVFEIVGDAFCCAFEKAEDAIKAAVAAQINLANEKWDDVKIKIRIGIHSGNVEWNGKRYMGYITLARTARVMSSVYGEQIIISNDTYELTKEKIPNKISFRDLGERRLKDLKQPVRLFQILSEGLREDFPPLKTLDARPNNLPVQLTSFIGRESEMKSVKNLLKQTHLLTLTGSGGSGKTRFALQVGADVIDDFANGVWFVELASLFEPALLPQAIMKVLDIKEEPKTSLEDTLCNYLREKEMLIILDNCEHLIEHCAKLTETLLSNSSKLKIIATSREGLRCQGEQIHRVLSLEVPDPKDQDSPEQLSQYEAVRLFIERALAVDSTFRVNNNNAPALAEICFQLDGIPLAIELAAARTKVLSVEKIYERLNDRFNLLTGGKRTSLPRQQTLRALIDWSYDLLSEKEKILWRRLSVFAGGWKLEAAEEVCSDEKIKKEDVLELLDQLVEKSIVFFEREKKRYGILVTLKHYGNKKLKEANETEVVFLKHLNYYLELSETAEPMLTGNEAKIWLEGFEEDHQNFQSAIDWSLNGSETEKGARLAGSLGCFWYIRGHYTLGWRILEKINARTEKISDSSLSQILKWKGDILTNLGEYTLAEKSHTEALALSRKLNKKYDIAASLSGLSVLSYYQGNYDEARKFMEENLIVFRELGKKRSIGSTLSNLGGLAFDCGEYEQAQNYFEKGLKLFRELNDKQFIASNIANLGNLELRKMNKEYARKYFEESYDLFREIGDAHGTGYALNNLGILESTLGNHKQAQNLLQKSFEFFNEIKDKRGMAFSLDSLGNESNMLREFDQAIKYCEESLALFTELGEKRGVALSLNTIGNVESSRGNHRKAKKFFEKSLRIGLQIKLKDEIAGSLLGFASILFAANNLTKAILMLGAIKSYSKYRDVVLEIRAQILQQQIINKLKKEQSDIEFSKYFEDGGKLNLDQAAELALKLLNDL